MAIKRIIWTTEADTQDEAIDTYREAYFNMDIRPNYPILVICDLGLWNGRRTGYRILSDCSLNQIFSVACGDQVTFYSDGYNIRCEDIHHDGTNNYIFKELTGDENRCAPLLDAIYYQKNLKTIKTLARRYSRSVLPYVAEIYGLPITGRKRVVA